MSAKARDRELYHARRNLNPHREARLAMLVFGQEYAAQSGGSMDFYDSLADGTKVILKKWCDELGAAPRATP